ncbi:MAG: GNAT family N-acetyltransferase [Verrucomicrobiales bacterium]|nr:GNAT family N-acetyltransferase [Verrucomicrobiales bacterium]
MELLTERLLLRDITGDDFDAMREIHGDSETMHFYGGAFPPETTTRWIELIRQSYAEHGFGFWAVERLGEGRMIGITGITYQLVDGESIPEIGYLYNREFWGNGYATEAATACRDFAFREMKFHRLISWMVPDNLPSRRVAERMGMTVWKEAVSPKSGMVHVVYSIDHDQIEL